MDNRTNAYVFVGFWKRVLATLIDAVINWALLPITIPIMIWSVEHRNILLYVLLSVAWTVVWLWLVVHFGGTPGKLVIRARIVDAHGRFLSWGRAVLRIVPTLVISANYILQMGAVVSRYPATTPHSSFLDIGRLLNEYGQPYGTFAMVLGFFIYVDIGVILLNRQKRAIHDFIAGSYVITKTSYEVVAEENATTNAQ